MIRRKGAPKPPPQKASPDARKSIAVFLGAGASKAFGYPLTSELLPDLIKFLGNKTLTRWNYSKRERQILRNGLTQILPGLHVTEKERLPLITDILTLIDHSVAVGSAVVAGWHPRQVTRFRGLLEEVIADMVFPDGAAATLELERLADWIEQIAATHRVGVITTNYDMELDFELFDRWGSDNVASHFDFGMSWRDPVKEIPTIYPRPTTPKVCYYKLHGSVNWLRCPLCEYIYVNVNGPVVFRAWESRSEYNTCHCGHSPLQSVLVTPSFVRENREVNLSGIWRTALDFLAMANTWVIIGYSMPPEDIAIRSLLIKADQVRKLRTKKRKTWVVQKGRGEAQRYSVLFPNATYCPNGLAKFDLRRVAQ